jgi:hypothetical protein
MATAIRAHFVPDITPEPTNNRRTARAASKIASQISPVVVEKSVCQKGPISACNASRDQNLGCLEGS